MSQVNYTHTISCYTVQSDGFMHWLQGGKKIHCFVAVPTLETGVPGKMMQSKSKHRPSWHYLALDDPDEDLWTYGLMGALSQVAKANAFALDTDYHRKLHDL